MLVFSNSMLVLYNNMLAFLTVCSKCPTLKTALKSESYQSRYNS